MYKMGSYFAKHSKPKNTSFESIERVIESLNPNDYPTFEKSIDWAKTRHVYSEQICFHEKYYSWAILGFLLFLVAMFCYGGHNNGAEAQIDIMMDD
jgi:hypothetical protein